MKTITLKIGNMKKAVEWVIYPGDESQEIKIQSDNRIALIDRKTRQCILSKHCANGAYSEHLYAANGATIIILSEDTINEIIRNQPKRGDSIGGGLYFFWLITSSYKSLTYLKDVHFLMEVLWQCIQQLLKKPFLICIWQVNIK